MLHPFFSYFGSKYRLALLYPAPTHKTIVEPFAGSAGYSLLYPSKNVVLYDIYEPVVALWQYLIRVSEKEILSLPVMEFSKEHPVSVLRIAPEAKMLLGFWITESQVSPSRYPLSASRGGNWTERKRRTIAEQLKYIRHWKADNKNYVEIDNPKATWFIDPPYKDAGKRYRGDALDYRGLALWCKRREGQVIVCEQNDAKWLSFKKLKHVNNASNKPYKEVVWSRG